MSTTQDLFHPDNTFCLLPRIDVAGRPIVVSANLFAAPSLKGRGTLAQECKHLQGLCFVSLLAQYTGVLTAETTSAPWVVSLKVPNRGRVMVDGSKKVAVQVNTLVLLLGLFSITHSCCSCRVSCSAATPLPTWQPFL